MIIPVRFVLLLPLVLGACEVKTQEPAAVAEADRALVASGTTPDEIAAARAYLAPFTTADQAPCFDEVALRDAAMRPREPDPFAATPGTTRVVVAIDGSGSMAARVGGRSKLDLAKEATTAFVDALGPDVDASLSVFGQQGDNSESGKARSCAAVDQLAAMSRDRAGFKAAVQGVRAVGWTPLAAALRQAQAQLQASTTPGEQVVYVVSDGNETCGGDPVATARAINSGETRAIVNIIGFDLPTADRAALQAVAQAGGGQLVNIADDAAYHRMIATIRESGRRNANIIAAGGARTHNIIDSGAAITRATLCTGSIITRETLDVGADLTRRDLDKQTVPERRVVFALLNQRHKAMTERRDAFQARLTGNRDTANQTIDEAEKAAE